MQFQRPFLFIDWGVWLALRVDFGTWIRLAQYLCQNSLAFVWSIVSGHGGSGCIVVREVCFRFWVLLFLRPYLEFEDYAMRVGRFVCLLLDHHGRSGWKFFTALNWFDWWFSLVPAVVEVIWLFRPFLIQFMAELCLEVKVIHRNSLPLSVLFVICEDLLMEKDWPWLGLSS